MGLPILDYRMEVFRCQGKNPDLFATVSNYVEITKEKLKQANLTTLNGCYASIFLKRIVTIRNKDWDKVKKYFEIPKHPLELERKEIKLKQ